MRASTAAFGAWNRFWFRPEPTSTLAVVRIAYGLVMSAWALSLAPDLAAFFAPSGFSRSGGGEAGMFALYVLLVAGSICLTLGYRTRLATVVVFITMMWFQRRNPFVLNAGDRLLANLGSYLMLAPAGVSLSLDRWRRAPEAFWDFPARAPWALRLVQVQLSVLYLSSVWEKLQGQTWGDGTAVSYALRIGQLARLQLPDWVSTSLPVANLLTWSTLAIELSLAVLVWSRRLRPWVLAAGVALHLSIELTMTVGFLAMAVLVAYLAFVPPDTMRTWLRRCVRRTEPAASSTHPHSDPR